MGKYGVIDFDEDEIEAAGHWYHDLYLLAHGAYRPGYEGSMLYAIMDGGALRGMADRSKLIDRAKRLEKEAKDAARLAATKAKTVRGDEKKELLADVKGLRSIAEKTRSFLREEAAKPRARHATKTRRAGFLAPEVRYAGTSLAPIPRPQTAADRRRIAAEVDSIIESARKPKGGHSTKKPGTKAADPAKAYNAHRLEEEFGGVWHSGADAQGYQDHWMETPDGTVWRPRVPHHYYSQASGKLMMVVSHRVLPKPEARWR